MSSGTITLRRPRVRGVEERFESRVLPLFATTDEGAGRSASRSCICTDWQRETSELAMRGLLGEGAPLSKSSIRRLRAGWTAEFEEWSQRRLEGREVVYVWADGIYRGAASRRGATGHSSPSSSTTDSAATRSRASRTARIRTSS